MKSGLAFCNMYQTNMIGKVTNFTIEEKSSEEERTKKSSLAYNASKHIVTDKNILNDLSYLIKCSHSGELEVFHLLCNMYCPKRIAFSCMHTLSWQLWTTILALKESN